MTTTRRDPATPSDRPRPRRTAGVLAAATGLAGLGLLMPSTASAADTATCTGDVTAIGAVQGSGATAAITGAVTVRGVVVGDNEGSSPTLQGFFVQDGGDKDKSTSDGIFVYAPGKDQVKNGDQVQVTGTAAEYQGQTQITATALSVCATGRSVKPTSVKLPLASADSLERYEGMLVRLPQKLTVTEHYLLGRFGQVTVSSGGRLMQPTNVYPADDPRSARLQAENDLNQLIIDDALNNQNPDPIVFGRDGEPLSATNTLRTGDTVKNAVGVLTYTWAGNSASPNAWRLRPVGALNGSADFTAANARPKKTEVDGDLKVASSNLLNYFNTFTGCTYGVGGEAADCRGAENATELERQTAKEVAALTSLDADVIGLMEIENDGYAADSAIAQLTDALNAATEPGTYAYVDTDAATGVTNVAGDDAIKVAMLYRPAAVTPVKTLVENDDLFERHPLSVTFETRKKARVSVVVNHFKSKGCDGATGTDTDQGDGQSCWNTHRVEQATTLASWIDTTVVPAAGDPDVLVIGDLNSYAKEDPILALAAAGYTDMIDRETGSEKAYSYVYDGQSGYLDQALASKSLKSQVKDVEDVHINADEPSVLDYNTNYKTAGQLTSLYAPDRFRTSDHDPVLIGLNLRR
ncbi:ExeM/NucH family extracellular endonuclease [Kineosporia sp. J2-2]|uniref:ExeM/NucH family extracellular endonuclease n=1 Tax=Kineosporia corallincola TaxID=2835133 RepID=A0ABS5TCS2_9ACTN|nr:ExeM/NucH family extracellular endonuclease [Kineosporia corallincola]MBT0767878.1 ExeM/NucH family extracellular endonuclease [Kineosporia corallincola]